MIETGSKVKIKKSNDDRIFVVENITRDRENNPMVNLLTDWENSNDYNDSTWYFEELEEILEEI